MSPPTIIHVVPHTHWDREWYEPFESYRFKLVKVVDTMLTTLDDDPAFRHFTFDGQTAAVEDYLDVRPPVEPEVARFVRDGRLSVGPWRILMDEFLCSPETIVRNLQQGRAMADRLGGAMPLGHIPDSFGHIGQMPQLLRLAGLADACVWRGVPMAVDRTVFTWRAPDGSEVRAIYLARSYANGASLPGDPEDLMVRARRIVSDLAPFEPGPVVLAMNGSDHLGIDPRLPALFAAVNRAQDEFVFRIGSLSEYLAEAPEAEATWTGEMRSGARANMLMGVLSARMPLKRAEFATSTALERYAEPLSALAGTDTGRLLDRAWRAMVENSAHDSICGCGVDEVADQVEARYRDAARVADLVAQDALEALAARIDRSAVTPGAMAVVAWNPSPRPRDGLVEVSVPAAGPAGGLAFAGPDGSVQRAQVLATHELRVLDMTMRGSQLAHIIPMVTSRMIGGQAVNGLRIEPGRTTTVRLTLGPVPLGRFDVEGAKAAVEAAIARQPRGRFHVVGDGPPLCRALARATIGPLGWTVLGPVDAPDAAVEDAASCNGNRIDNGLLRVEVGPRGEVRLTDLTSGEVIDDVLVLEDGGDAGDEYNYSPPEADVIVNGPDGAVVVDEAEPGPLRATLRVSMTMRVPASLSPGERSRARRTVPMPVQMDLSLCTGEPFLRVAITVENGARDHRLRARVRLPAAVAGSHADGAFEVVERGLIGEGGGHEYALPTFPARRWVDCSDGSRGLAVFLRGTPEYEVVDGATIAITLIRSVGWLSRQGMAYRAGGAGPHLPTPGAQVPGTHRVELAIYPHHGDLRAGNVADEAERFAYPLRAHAVAEHAGGSSDLPATANGLAIEPSAVALSALVRTQDGVDCRVYNATATPTRATLRPGPTLPASSATLVGIHGDPRGDLEVRDGAVTLALRAWEIATVRLR